METNLTNAVIISLVGFSVVFICLIVFAVIISIMNKTDRLLTKNKKKRLELASERSKNINSDIDTNIIPILVAAAYSTFGPKIIIRKIDFANKEDSQDSLWSRFSRTSALSIHNKIRRRGS